MGGYRESQLVEVLKKAILATSITRPKVLDFGTGSTLVISELYEHGAISGYCGIDTYSPDEDFKKTLDKNRNYSKIETLDELLQFNGFEVAIACDVLHHLDWEEIPKVVDYLSRITKYVIVKDCFEYGFFTRQLIRLSDWFGNSAYGVNIPKRYLSISDWDSILGSLGLIEVQRFSEVKIHHGLFGILLPSRCHFVSILRVP